MHTWLLTTANGVHTGGEGLFDVWKSNYLPMLCEKMMAFLATGLFYIFRRKHWP